MKTSLKIMACCAFVISLGNVLSAQEQYTIKMNMKLDGLPPEYAAMAEQEITTWIRNDQQKSEISGMMGSTLVYYDGKKMTTLMDQMGQKRGFTATKEELEEDEKKKGTSKPTIQYIDESRQIAG